MPFPMARERWDSQSRDQRNVNIQARLSQRFKDRQNILQVDARGVHLLNIFARSEQRWEHPGRMQRFIKATE